YSPTSSRISSLTVSPTSRSQYSHFVKNGYSISTLSANESQCQREPPRGRRPSSLPGPLGPLFPQLRPAAVLFVDAHHAGEAVFDVPADGRQAGLQFRRRGETRPVEDPAAAGQLLAGAAVDEVAAAVEALGLVLPGPAHFHRHSRRDVELQAAKFPRAGVAHVLQHDPVPALLFCRRNEPGPGGHRFFPQRSRGISATGKSRSTRLPL